MAVPDPPEPAKDGEESSTAAVTSPSAAVPPATSAMPGAPSSAQAASPAAIPGGAGSGEAGSVAPKAVTPNAPAIPQFATQTGFLLFCVLFAFLSYMAWGSSSVNITNSVPAIVTALLGLVTNPLPGSGQADESVPAFVTAFLKRVTNLLPSNLQAKKSVNWTQLPWRALVIVGALSTTVCALALIIGNHKAAQGAFEVAAGGLFGLLINTSQLTVYQPLLTAIAKAVGVDVSGKSGGN
jgi:hypothetical protein